MEASWLRSQENLINSKQLNPDLFAKRNTRVPWGSDEVTEDPQHDLNTEFAAKDLLHNDGILSDALSKFIRCGVLRTKANDSSTSQAVLDRIGVPVEMIYRVNGDHSEADWHTGIPYTDPIPKISILQAEKNLTERSHLGSLQLIDGLKVAEKMYQTAYHHYRILCETPVNYCHTSQQKTNAAIGNSMPIFTLNQEGQMERITFNNRFRQVPTGMSSSELIKFYEALGLFYKFCQDPVNSITLSVHSGDIIVLANDRVLTKTQPKAEVCQWLSESYVTINGWDPVKPKLRDMSKGEIPL